MNDEQVQPLLEVWLHDRDEAPRDANGGLARVMARVPEVPQQGRWWPLPVLHRKAKAKTPTTNDMTAYQPSPIRATNGHAPIVIGRTRTMFSPVKAIAAGALVFAIGGVFLIAQPFDQQGSVPGAEQGAEARASTTGVTIKETDGTVLEPDVCTTHEDGYQTCTGASSSQYSATDPRLSGTLTERVIEYNDGEIEVWASELVNDEGTWVGTGWGTGSPSIGVSTLIGERAYEGLTARLISDFENYEDHLGSFIIRAVIVEGELPQFPELPSQ